METPISAEQELAQRRAKWAKANNVGLKVLDLCRQADRRRTGEIAMTVGSDEAGIYSNEYGGFLVGGGPIRGITRHFRSGDILRRIQFEETDAPDGAPHFPVVDETSRADGSRWGGLQAYWRAETNEISMTRAKFAFYGGALLIVVAIGAFILDRPAGLPALAFVLIVGLSAFAMYRTWRDQHTYS